MTTIKVYCIHCFTTIQSDTFTRCACEAIAVDGNRIIGDLDKAVILKGILDEKSL